MTSILITSFIAFIITGIPTVLENLFLQAEEAEQIQDQSPPTLDENNNGIISEEICPPYCNSPPPIQELPQKQPP
ncbi:MAG TPA: hypothetical protein VHJ38_11830 [Nitrososphaeraceae archaeon]|nr:hypothetical protein [Nitrososphaeraceae archaeon]